MPIQTVGAQALDQARAGARRASWCRRPAQFTAMPRGLRGAREHVPDRMDAERKRVVHALAGAAADAVEGPRERQQRRSGCRSGCADRRAACRSRRPSASTRRSPSGGRTQNRLVELPVGERAQHLLVEDRNAPPLLGIVEAIDVHVLELSAVERRALRLRERMPACARSGAPRSARASSGSSSARALCRSRARIAGTLVRRRVGRERADPPALRRVALARRRRAPRPAAISREPHALRRRVLRESRRARPSASPRSRRPPGTRRRSGGSR